MGFHTQAISRQLVRNQEGDFAEGSVRDLTKASIRCDRGRVERRREATFVGENIATQGHKLYVDTYLTLPPSCSLPHCPLPRRQFPLPRGLLRSRHLRARPLRAFRSACEYTDSGDGVGWVWAVASCVHVCARTPRATLTLALVGDVPARSDQWDFSPLRDHA